MVAQMAETASFGRQKDQTEEQRMDFAMVLDKSISCLIGLSIAAFGARSANYFAGRIGCSQAAKGRSFPAKSSGSMTPPADSEAVRVGCPPASAAS